MVDSTPEENAEKVIEIAMDLATHVMRKYSEPMTHDDAAAICMGMSVALGAMICTCMGDTPELTRMTMACVRIVVHEALTPAPDEDNDNTPGGKKPA